jgi:hypothetical protein
MTNNIQVNEIIEKIKKLGGTVHYNGGDPDSTDSYSFGIGTKINYTPVDTENFAYKVIIGDSIIHDFGFRGLGNVSFSEEKETGHLVALKGVDMIPEDCFTECAQKEFFNMEYKAFSCISYFERREPVNLLVYSLDKHDEEVKKIFDNCVKEGREMNVRYV